MGLIQSANVCDAMFLQRVEKRTLLPKLLARLGVVHYWRYRDDILGIVDTDISGTYPARLFRHMKANCKYFKLDIAEYGSRSTTFLDMQLTMSHNRVSVDYYAKPNLGPPLSPESGHHPSTHRSWPGGTIQRIRNICSSSRAADTAVSNFLSRFTEFSIPSVFQVSAAKASCPRPLTMWVPIAFHPFSYRAVMRGFEAHLAEFPCLTGQLFGRKSTVGSHASVFKPAWYNKLPMLHIRLRSLQRALL